MSEQTTVLEGCLLIIFTGDEYTIYCAEKDLVEFLQERLHYTEFPSNRRYPDMFPNMDFGNVRMTVEQIDE
jgi:hypothetical protein